MNDELQIIWVLFSMGLAFAYLWLMGRYSHYWKAIDKVVPTHQEPLELLIVFRNEEAHLPALLKSMEHMSYPPELVHVTWVNDHSTDRSVQLIQEGLSRYPFTVLDLGEDQGKKAGLRLAWKQIGQGLVVQTDADCVLPPDWLNHLVAPFADPATRFVSGPVSYGPDGGFFRRWLHIDLSSLVAIGGAHIQWGRPLLCNGANLAFRLERLPDDLEDDKASGDDVFLMQGFAKEDPRSVRFVPNREARVGTQAPRSFLDFVHQRLRWASKNGRYADRSNRGILWLSWLVNWVMLLNLLFWQPFTHLILLFMFLLKLLGEANFLIRVHRQSDLGKGWHWVHLLGQPFHMLYMALVPILSTFVPYRWKERTLR